MRQNRGVPLATAPAVRFHRLIAVGLVLAAWATYYRALEAPFLFDDRPAIDRNETIRQLWPPTIPLSPPVTGAGVAGRPLVNLSLALNFAASGLAPRGYHATNILLHICATLTLWGLLRRTFQRTALKPDAEKLAGGIAFLWSVHPLQTESVVCVVQRNELLVGWFYLLALYCFARSIDEPRGAWWRAAAIVAGLLGTASKEVMATAPLLVLLYDRTFVGGSFRTAWRDRWRFHLGLGSTWLLLAWLMQANDQRAGTVGFGLGVSSWHYLLTQCNALLTYLKLSVWPHPLIADYGVDVVHSLTAVGGEAFVVSALLAATVFALWRHPAIGWAAAAFFIVLAPSSSFVPLTTQPIAEHRMYLSLAAVLALLVLALHRLCGRTSLAATTAVVVAFAATTAARTRVYETEISLWSDTVAKSPGNARAEASLGGAFARAKRWPEALRHFELAVQQRPDYADAHNDYATVLGETGRTADAVGHFETALRLKPDDTDIRYNLGVALAQAGRPDEAVEQLQRVLQRTPDRVSALNNLGDALLKLGRPSEALVYFRRALELEPNSSAAHNNAGVALGALGQLREAIPHFEAALRENPNSAQTHYNLAQALAGIGRLQEAIAHDETALQLQPNFASARGHLQQIRQRQ